MERGGEGEGESPSLHRRARGGDSSGSPLCHRALGALGSPPGQPSLAIPLSPPRSSSSSCRPSISNTLLQGAQDRAGIAKLEAEAFAAKSASALHMEAFDARSGTPFTVPTMGTSPPHSSSFSPRERQWLYSGVSQHRGGI